MRGSEAPSQESGTLSSRLGQFGGAGEPVGHQFGHHRPAVKKSY